MENKPQNVFEKLDKQGEQIEDISQRLEGISINDLYALAKRTWDYGDFQTAQKYYNHISLLKPLDWEAPLYASLCNFKGYHDMFFWTKVPEQTEKIIISTIRYINSLELDSDKKESEMSKCIEIIEDNMLKTKDHYFKYKKEYDDTDSDYIYVLEEYFLNVYNEIKNVELKAIKVFNISLVENCLSLIESTKKISSKISKDVYEELIGASSKSFSIDFDKIVEENKAAAKPKNDLSLEEIKEIKLKGKMYFEYNDKVISKRINKSNLILGALIAMVSASGVVVSILGKWYWLFPFIFPLIFGVLLVVKAFVQKDKIKCSSLLNAHREKNRLTSDGNVVSEKRFSIMGIFAFLMNQLTIWVGIMIAIFALSANDGNVYALPLLIVVIADCILSYVGYIKTSNEYHSRLDGKYSYYYNGKYYKFDR